MHVSTEIFNKTPTGGIHNVVSAAFRFCYIETPTCPFRKQIYAYIDFPHTISGTIQVTIRFPGGNPPEALSIYRSGAGLVHSQIWTLLLI